MISPSGWDPWYADPSLPGWYSIEASMGTMFAPVGGGSWYQPIIDIAGQVLSSVGARGISTGLTTGTAVSTIPQRTPGSLPGVPDQGWGVATLPSVDIFKQVWGRRPYRRMNACNPKALKRAIRRVKRFEKFAKQSIRIAKKVKTPRKRTCR